MCKLECKCVCVHLYVSKCVQAHKYVCDGAFCVMCMCVRVCAAVCSVLCACV